MAQKLYTEEQVRDVLSNMLLTTEQVESIFEELTPIELPSDEEIEEYCDDVRLEQYYIDGAIDGAKWMRDKILNR